MYDLVPVKLCCHLLFAMLSCNVFLSSFSQTCSYQTHVSMVPNCGDSLGWERPNRISQFIPSVNTTWNDAAQGKMVLRWPSKQSLITMRKEEKKVKSVKYL